MQPGYLHFDVRRGLTADLINASLLALARDHNHAHKALAQLDIAGLAMSIDEVFVSGIKGHAVEFFLDGERIVQGKAGSALSFADFDDNVTIAALSHWLAGKSLSSSVRALSLKVLEQLHSPAFVAINISRTDALWLVCNVVVLAAQIDALDPKFITATKICIGEPGADKVSRGSLSLTDTLWLNQIVKSLPVIEVRDVIPVDVVSAAFIKALAGHVGPRGESRIINIGLGIAEGNSFDTPRIVEALWCEPSLPTSINDHGLGNYARLDSLHEVTGAISAMHDITKIAAAMSLHGAQSITWHLASYERNQSCYVMRFLVMDNDKRDAIEAFLIKGGAFDVSVSVVERHELNRRLVSVPIGTGNKAYSSRFYEYIYLDKTVRVEPLNEDLEKYVQRTDYSVDVARSDLLMAWKKWRGRAVSEDA